MYFDDLIINDQAHSENEKVSSLKSKPLDLSTILGRGMLLLNAPFKAKHTKEVYFDILQRRMPLGRGFKRYAAPHSINHYKQYLLSKVLYPQHKHCGGKMEKNFMGFYLTRFAIRRHDVFLFYFKLYSQSNSLYENIIASFFSLL